jgi:hypothetical protein
MKDFILVGSMFVHFGKITILPRSQKPVVIWEVHGEEA